MINETNENVLPLLVNFSVLRTGGDSLPGYYDSNNQVWVVEGDHGVKPIIEAAGDLAELSTKTEMRPERDDVTEPLLMALLQLVTKTKAQQERDD